MGSCCLSLSKCTLLTTNTLLFFISAAALGVCVYIFSDGVGSALTNVNLLTIFAAASVALMVFSTCGCATALKPPHRKCTRCMYLTILLVLCLAEFSAAVLFSDLTKSLQIAKEHNFDVKDDVDRAAVKTIHYLHDQLSDFYDQEHCNGGVANATKLPVGFSKVSCEKRAGNVVFDILFQDDAITDETGLLRYTNCVADPYYSDNANNSATTFTQAFCSSESHIVSLTQKYARYLMWFPVFLGVLTLFLLVATICLIARKEQRPAFRAVHDPRRVQLMMHGP